jgi:hypothetical protein
MFKPLCIVHKPVLLVYSNLKTEIHARVLPLLRLQVSWSCQYIGIEGLFRKRSNMKEETVAYPHATNFHLQKSASLTRVKMRFVSS